jgi:hypothetical protein
MRRRTLVILLVVSGLTVLVGLEVVALSPHPSRDTRENFNRIKPGMGRVEVEAILGLPGDYTTGPASEYRSLNDPIGFFSVPGTHQSVWTTDEGKVLVGYDANDQTVDAQFKYLGIEHQGPVDNLLWRLKRQWHRWFPE